MSLDMVKVFIFNFLQFLINNLQNFVLEITGNYQQHRSFETSAQLFKIVCRFKPKKNWTKSSKNDFIAIHQSYCHPNIIHGDNMSLYTLTKSEAIFVDCSTVNVFDSKHVFVYNGQFKYATRIIVLPLSSFHLIAKKIAIPKVPVIHLANHGRCGSTLLSRLFEAIPGALSISETNPFNDLTEFSRTGDIDQSSLKEILKSTMMCTLKHANERKSKVVFIKCQNVIVYITDLFLESVPFVKQVYMYRQPVRFVQSFEKLEYVNKWALDSEWHLILSGMGCHNILQMHPTYSLEEIRKLKSFSRWALIWITASAAFNYLVENGFNIRSLKYEDLVNDPKQVLTALFEYAGLSRSSMPDVDKILSQDSQAGTPFSSRDIDKKELEKHLTPITTELKEEVQELCKDFKVPQFWEDSLQLPKHL